MPIEPSLIEFASWTGAADPNDEGGLASVGLAHIPGGWTDRDSEVLLSIVVMPYLLLLISTCCGVPVYEPQRDIHDEDALDRLTDELPKMVLLRTDVLLRTLTTFWQQGFAVGVLHAMQSTDPEPPTP